MKRPASVLVLSIINLIWGALGVCGLVWGLLARFQLIQLPGQNNQLSELMQTNAAFRIYSDLSTLVGVPATIIIISASIGMIALQGWARLATIGWGIYTIVVTCLGALLNHVLLFRPALEQTTGPERLGVKIGMLTAYAVSVAIVVYCAGMVFVLCRPRVKDAFRGEEDLLLPNNEDESDVKVDGTGEG